MQIGYDDIKAMLIRKLREKEAVTSEELKTDVEKTLAAFASVVADNIDVDTLHRDLLSHVSVWQPEPSVLRDRDHVNWVLEYKPEMQKGFWSRYRDYLEEEKGWSTKVTSQLDKTTDSILGDIGNPRDTRRWDRRGMVVGEVQSGKTANYTGLICKATDAGYKLIIVLAGMTNDLRSQTQSRLDAEYLGFESEVGKLHSDGSRIGVGKFRSQGSLIVQPLTFSSHGGDFRANKSANLKLGGNPLLLVVKKNRSVLERISAWAEGQGDLDPDTSRKIVKDVPLLLLDDEADNASVDTSSPDDDPSSINKAIRRILNAFSHSSYVGYTATPFANIFIKPDDEDADPSVHGPDLFPKNFIYYINPPSHYVGAERLFGLADELDGVASESSGLPLVRDIDDSDDVFPPKHKKDLIVTHLPQSLHRALHSFALVCAARRVRGQLTAHNSMLIHVTRFNQVQKQVMDLVSETVISMQRTLEYRTGAPYKQLIDELKGLWESDFVKTTQMVAEQTPDDKRIVQLNWEDIEQELSFAVLRLDVRGINGDAKGVLDYDKHPQGLSVIAVGGDKLSRGLTLEGLSVSYYTRPSKNYDTLLQMGRWFGYRPGYLDLCRLFTPAEIVSWYQHISLANEELKREFQLMELSRLTPQDYGLKVRTHPDGLEITSANKIRNGKRLTVTFSGQLSQTTVFPKSSEVLADNLRKTEEWLISLGTPPGSKWDNSIWEKVSPLKVVQFLESFYVHPLARKAEPDLLSKYIQKLNEYGELKEWTVVLVSSATPKRHDTVADRRVGLVRRTDASPNDNLYMLKNANIISPNDQLIDLNETEIKHAMNRTMTAFESGALRSKNAPKMPSGPYIREARPKERGLLLIYPLDPQSVTINGTQVTSAPIIGFAISFPKGSRDDVVEYQVNTTYWRERYGEVDDA